MANLHYETIPIEENGDPLVDIGHYGLFGEPAYYQQGLSDSPTILVRRQIAEKLAHIQDTSLPDYRFKIWDAWRPRSVQGKIYQRYWKELEVQHPDWGEEKLRSEIKHYVSSPDASNKTPQHSTGGAIDLTLISRTSGSEINMGTCFDHFGIEASPFYFENETRYTIIRSNRHVLFKAMGDAGFTVDPDEWWHFDYGNQKWAEQAKRPTAIYGEISPPAFAK